MNYENITLQTNTIITNLNALDSNISKIKKKSHILIRFIKL